MKRKRGAPKPLVDVENAVVIVPVEPDKSETEAEDPAVADWNAFAQDHYELVEQLPLSLHRSFSLIRELDDMVQDNTSRIVPATRAYIGLRESMLRKPKVAGVTSGLDLLAHVSAAVEPPQPQPQPHQEQKQEQGPTNPVPNLAPSPPPIEPVPVQVPPTTADPNPIDPSGPSATANLAPAHPALVPPPAPSFPTSSRALLTLIATLASDSVRASNEKVGIANNICQTVDNHLRSLDALIAQHRATLPRELDPEPEPELEPPSPSPAEDEEQRETIPPLRITRTGTTPTAIRIRNRSASKSKPTEDSGGSSPSRKPKSVPMNKGSSGSNSSKSSSRAPVQPSSTAQPKTSATPARRNRPPPRNKKATETDDQSDERRYCYCNEVSFGEMVACDGECEREWFHLPCVGLQTAPGHDTKWYCRDCQATQSPKKKQRKN